MGQVFGPQKGTTVGNLNIIISANFWPFCHRLLSLPLCLHPYPSAHVRQPEAVSSRKDNNYPRDVEISIWPLAQPHRITAPANRMTHNLKQERGERGGERWKLAGSILVRRYPSGCEGEEKMHFFFFCLGCIENGRKHFRLKTEENTGRGCHRKRRGRKRQERGKRDGDLFGEGARKSFLFFIGKRPSCLIVVDVTRINGKSMVRKGGRWKVCGEWGLMLAVWRKHRHGRGAYWSLDGGFKAGRKTRGNASGNTTAGNVKRGSMHPRDWHVAWTAPWDSSIFYLLAKPERSPSTGIDYRFSKRFELFAASHEFNRRLKCNASAYCCSCEDYYYCCCSYLFIYK